MKKIDDFKKSFLTKNNPIKGAIIKGGGGSRLAFSGLADCTATVSLSSLVINGDGSAGSDDPENDDSDCDSSDEY